MFDLEGGALGQDVQREAAHVEGVVVLPPRDARRHQQPGVVLVAQADPGREGVQVTIQEERVLPMQTNTNYHIRWDRRFCCHSVVLQVLCSQASLKLHLVYGLSYQCLLVPVRMVMFNALGEHDDQRLGEVENLGRMRGDIVWNILSSSHVKFPS